MPNYEFVPINSTSELSPGDIIRSRNGMEYRVLFVGEYRVFVILVGVRGASEMGINPLRFYKRQEKVEVLPDGLTRVSGSRDNFRYTDSHNAPVGLSKSKNGSLLIYAAQVPINGVRISRDVIDFVLSDGESN